jgi:hypothetical protein
VVVDGTVEMVGSREPVIRQKILEAAAVSKIPLALALDGERLQIRGPGVPVKAALSLIFIQDRAESDVLRGENKGRHLVHTAVALSKENLGTLPLGEAWERIAKMPGKRGTRVVAVLQDVSTMRILGAGDQLLAGGAIP